MPRGQPQGEEIYRPEVNPEDLPRKIVPEIRQPPVIGEAFGRAIQTGGDALERKYQADAATWAGKQIAQTRTQTVLDLDKAKSELPADQDPTGFTQRFISQFDKNTNDLVQNSDASPVARAMVQKGLGEFRDQLITHTTQWEGEQNVAYRQNAVKEYTKSQAAVVEAHPELLGSVGSTASDMVNASGGDPRNRLALMRDVDAQLSQAAAFGISRQNPRGTLDALNNPEKAPAAFESLSRLNDAQREAIRAKANGHLSDPVFSALAQDDTRGAQRYLDANRDVMDPKTAWELERRIDAQVKEKQNEQKQDIADRYQDSLKAAEFGLPNSTVVTKAELAILYPKDPGRHWDILQSAQQAGAQSREYARMTPEAIVADVEKSKPTEGGREAALQIAGYEVRARAAERSIRERQADPAEFAIRNGSWQPLDFSDPKKVLENLTSRANTQEEISRQSGVDTRLLSKPEQQTLTRYLESQPPDQRLSTLTQLRQAMPNDVSYGSLMRQIAPGSPLTAIAGATLDKPVGASWYQPQFATPPVVGQRILEGDAILAPKKNEKGEIVLPKFPMPSDKDLQIAFASAAGGANSDLFRGRDQTQEAYYAAYKAVYAAESSAQGKTNGVYDSNLAQLAAQSVLGHVMQYGHSAVSVPAGMDPTHFEGLVNAATRATLTQGGYSKGDIGAFRGYGLREIGDTLGTGRYVIINGNGDPLKSKDGKDTLYLDLNRQLDVPVQALGTNAPGFPSHGR